MLNTPYMPSTKEVFFYINIPYYDIEAYILELCYFYMTYPKKAIFVNGKFIHKLIRFNALEILLLVELPKIEINENRKQLRKMLI